MFNMMENPYRVNYKGNYEILELETTAFLCSRRVPASIVLKSFDWAREICRKQHCVISGNHSQIEKDVFHFLLKGKQPLILALARGLKQRIEPELEAAISSKRLLIVTPFAGTVKRVTEDTAIKRNETMAEMADELFVAYAQPEGNVEQLVLRQLKNKKKVIVFGVEENRQLMDIGAKPYHGDT
jgi:predicted Rossmann fold nucleotide-binding protein DprA/Smf involved in DNA uptake